MGDIHHNELTQRYQSYLDKYAKEAETNSESTKYFHTRNT